MKTILFASTALVAFAGAAAAQGVALSGNAEMGIYDNDTAGMDTRFFTDIDVTFTMSGETDNGLTFGASVDLDEGGSGAAAVANNDDDGGATIFLSGSFGTITMGDTDGALDWATAEVGFNAGAINDDFETAGWNGVNGLDGKHDGQILRYDNTFGAFGVAVSAEIDDTGTDDAILGVGVRYGADFGGTTINFGLGYQSGEDAGVDIEAIAVSANANFGAVTAGVVYEEFDDGVGGAGYDHVGVGVGYTTGAISLHANYGVFDRDGGTEDKGLGLSAGYDLGGGASVQLGYGSSDTAGVDTDSWSLGVRMNF